MDFACRLFDKIINPCWVTQMVTAMSEFGDLTFIGIVFDKMPQNDSAWHGSRLQGYSQYGQLREALYSYHPSLMVDVVGNWMA